MRVLLLNVPHPSIGSRIPDDHLPPLGLLSIGGPLIDDGHEVRLLDADLEAGRSTTYSAEEIAAETADWRPDAVLFGHSGSTSAHPVVAEVSRAVRRLLPRATIVYGGVFPTYHWREILQSEPQIDVIVRGEGERTCVALFRALQDGGDLRVVAGLGLRTGGTPPAPVIVDLDRYRVGWELIDHRRYSYWGGMRAVVVQFSRGCPHPCTYCGQRGFWTKWRYRDPVKFAGELARLYREHGVELINFADENPTVDRQAWKRFLEALIAENVPLTLVGSTRADDIVRDADLLPLYRKAGWVRFLLGMENTDEDTLKLIRKGGSTTKDREAIRLLRDNGILSMATWVAGFEEDDDRSFWRGFRQLLAYDPDQIQALYVTPHRWTPYFRLAASRRVIQDDVRRWDYKHQVLSTRHLPPWRVILWVKAIEALVQLRPKAIWRTFFQPDRRLRHGMRWYAQMGRRVWFFELRNFLFRDRRLARGPSLEEFWGTPQDAEERSMQTRNYTGPMKRIALVPFFALALPAFAASALADTLDVGDGVKVWYTIKGQGGGPPIIVVHGGPGMDSGSLRGDLGPLEVKHRLLYYDQRGGGRSSLPAETKLLTIDHHVDDLEALRRHLGVDKVVLIGHSFGPAIIAGYAIKYPGHVDRMVLLGPIPPRKGKFVEEYGATMSSRLTDAQQKRSSELRKQYESGDVVAACREFWAINTVPRLSKSVKPSVVKSDFCTAPPEAIRYGTAKTSPTTFGSLGDWDWTADLKKVSAPALIIHGEEDAIPMAMVAEWASALPNARLMKVSNAAHFPYAERPDVVFPEIEKFLAP